MEFLPNKSRAAGTYLVGFQKNLTLVSYVSTIHDNDKVDAETGKSEIIMEYNRTKDGVDTVAYLVSRRTQRWPFAIFMALLNK